MLLVVQMRLIIDMGPAHNFLTWSASASRNSSKESLTQALLSNILRTATNMPGTVRNTVDRLDKPSAYYQSRVSCADLGFLLVQPSVD